MTRSCHTWYQTANHSPVFTKTWCRNLWSSSEVVNRLIDIDFRLVIGGGLKSEWANGGSEVVNRLIDIDFRLVIGGGLKSEWANGGERIFAVGCRGGKIQAHSTSLKRLLTQIGTRTELIFSPIQI